MKFIVSRDALLKPLSLVAGVVESRHTKPVLSNILLRLDGEKLLLLGSDAEIQISAHIEEVQSIAQGEITVPAKKLLDICNYLPDGSMIEAYVDNNQFFIRSGKSRFTLTTLPADDFPVVKSLAEGLAFNISAKALLSLIDSTDFAMAQQDVRYF